MSSDDSPQKGKKSASNDRFSMSKSAINDLPSTAVQSIHIENDVPVSVCDDVFAWKGEGSQTNMPKTARGKQLTESITRLKNLVTTPKQQQPVAQEEKKVEKIEKIKEERKVEKVEKIKEEMKTQKTTETVASKNSSTTLIKAKRPKAPAKQPSKNRLLGPSKTKLTKKK